VDTAKACTNNLLGVLAADAPALCRSVLSAVGRTRREGSAALDSLQAAVDPLIAPVKEPLMAQVEAMTALVSAPEELRAPIERLEASALGRGAELAASVGARRARAGGRAAARRHLHRHHRGRGRAPVAAP
jgi:hypothetical protein